MTSVRCSSRFIGHECADQLFSFRPKITRFTTLVQRQPLLEATRLLPNLLT